MDPIDFELRANDLESWCAVSEPLGLGGAFDTECTHCHGEVWTSERLALHAEVLTALGEVPARAGRAALLLAGLPGAGKSDLRRYLAEEHELDEDAVVVDVDEIRDVLIEALHRSGSLPVPLESWRPGGLPLTPRELSGSCHGESRRLRQRRVESLVAGDHPSLVIDTTLRTKESGSEWVRTLRESGYEEVTGILLDTPPEDAMVRCRLRWQRGVADWFDGAGLGGRFIASTNFQSYFSPGSTDPSCVEAFDALEEAGPPEGFDSVRRFVLVEQSGVLRPRRTA